MRGRVTRFLILGFITVFLLSAAFGVDRYYRNRVFKENKLRLQTAMTSTVDDIETGIHLREIVADGLAAFLLTSLPLAEKTKFNRYADLVLARSPQIRALEYVDADNIVRYVFPLADNEAAVGLNLMERPAAPYVEKSRTQYVTTISDPVLTAQGSLSTVIRVPVVKGGRYLGLAQAVCDVSPLFDRVTAGLRPDFAVRIADRKGIVFWGPNSMKEPTVEAQLALPSSGWTVTLGWLSNEPRPSPFVLGLIWGIDVLVSVNVIVWVYRTLRRIAGLSESIQLTSANLKASEERYRTLVETADDFILQLDLAGRILFANRAYRERGSGETDVQEGQEPAVAAEGEDLARIVESLPDSATMGRHSIEYVVSDRRGGPFYRYGHINLIRDEEGRPSSFLVIVRDVTGRKKLEQQASTLQAEMHQVQKMEALGRLAAGIAHDFNNIMMVINGNAELIRLGVPGNERLVSIADAIVRAGSRAANLVGQLLSYTRKKSVTPRIVSLNDEISQVKEILLRLIPENIVIHLHLASDLWTIKADPSQLEQIVVNLAVNGRDAMLTGGELSLETSNVKVLELQHGEFGDLRPGEYVLLKVRDTGQGMSPEVKSRIFEPFFSTKKRDMGTGLGLATVYGIVQQVGGHIYVSSEENEGTEFGIHIPRADADARAARGPEETESTVIEDSPHGETILLAEDDSAIRVLARNLLEEQGYQVLEAADGREALTLARDYSGTVDLLLSDVVMPHMDGKQLAAQLSSRFPHIKVIFMSGYNDEDSFQLETAASSATLLQKPFTLNSLLAKVREVLDLHS